MKALFLYLSGLILWIAPRSLGAQSGYHSALACFERLEAQAEPRSESAGTISRYRIDRQALAAFWQAPRQEVIRLQIPGAEEDIDIPLREIDLYGPDFAVQTSAGDTFAAPAARYYQYSTLDTMAAVAIFPDRLVGQFTWGDEHWTLAPEPGDELHYALSPDQALPATISGTCHTTDELGPDLIRRVQSTRQSSTTLRRQLPPLDIYFELDYHLFREQNRSVDRSVQFFMHLFNEVALIFRREGIQVRVKRIKVWTGPTPFNDRSASSALYTFRRYLSREVSQQDWDMAMLISRYSTDKLLAPNGGLAAKDALCKTSQRQAYANIHDYYEIFPAFSWSVFVVAHEIGHVIAAPHTHNCFWPGGPIDDCYCPEGRCDLGPPADARGGTIMSYCYLAKPFSSLCSPLPRDSNPGVDFLLGFGKLPGDLLRTTMAERTCLQEKNLDSLPNLQFIADSSFRIRAGMIDLRGLQIRNTGLAPAGPFSLQFFATDSPDFLDTYLPWGEFSLAGLASGDTLSLDTLFTLDSVPGPHLGLWLDPRDSLLEYHEGDNLLWLMEQPHVPQPKLLLENRGHLFDATAYFAVQDFWVENVGDTTSGDGRIDYFLCRDTLPEVRCYDLGYAPIPALDTGDIHRMNLFFFKKDLSLPAGDYYLSYRLEDPSRDSATVEWGWFDPQTTISLDRPQPGFLRSGLSNSDIDLLWDPGSRILRLDQAAPNEAPLDIRIWSSLGQLAASYRFPARAGFTLRIPLGTLPSGIYWVQVRRGREMITRRIWVAR